jgi:hypothetical protein
MAAAASFNGSYDKWRLDDIEFGSTHGMGSFEAAVDGTDARPFVYRQLLPMFANWIDARFSEQAKDRLFNLKGRTGLLFRERIIDSPIARDRTYFLRYWIVYAVVFLFAFISVYAMYLVGKATGFSPPAAALAAIAMILLIPYFQEVAGHFYDYPELAFFALAVWMAIKLDWWWIVPLAALATWNKESFLLFIPALYPFIRQRSSRLRTWAGMGVLVLTSAAVYLFIHAAYRNNPGSTAVFHLMDHIQFLPHLYNPHVMVLTKTYGLWAPPSENLLVIGLISWTAWRVWRSLPQAIKRHMQFAAIINFPLFFLLGYPLEVRGLSMLYVSLFLLLAANLTEWMSGQTKAAIHGATASLVS